MARSGEKDWLAVQAGYLNQLDRILHHYGNPPLVIAGDVFDDGWRPGRCSPALINFAIQHLPHAYAVPGQHDAPMHRYSDIKKSAYWTLVEAGKVTNLDPGEAKQAWNGVTTLHGFPWGFPVQPNQLKDRGLHVAVVHQYIWVEGTAYLGAPEENSLGKLSSKFRGYGAAVIGDNHTPWEGGIAGCRVRNGGTFVRRKADEVDYKPSVGLLDADGFWSRHFLDVSGDVIEVVTKPAEARHLDAGELVATLEGMGAVDLDFGDACRRYMDANGTPEAVRDRVTKFLEGAE